MLPDQPKKIEKYNILSILGQGAMGVVYKGYDKEIDRYVAIKVLHPHLLAGDMGHELEQRFKHEVQAAAKCLHQNIVTIFNCGLYNSSPYMVMEYVEGIDLGMALKSKQHFSLEKAINIMCNVLDALFAAHKMGIVHRDIKPANILLMDNGSVKVTDFGVAKIDNSDLTQIGDVIGTPSYMSPEAKLGLVVDNRSDIYSAALVLFETLTLRRLKPTQINHEGLSETLEQLEIADSKKINLVNILNRALESEPEQRYQTAQQLSKDLIDLLSITIDTHRQAEDLAETVIHLKRSITPSTTPPHSQTSHSQLSQLHEKDLPIIEKSLTKYLGPVAKVLIKKQAKKDITIDQLVTSLTGHIPSKKEQDDFMHSLESSGILKNTNNEQVKKFTLSNEELEQLTQQLVIYIGPVAKHVIKASLKKARTRNELNNMVAEKIQDLGHRQLFLDEQNNTV